jgi:NADH dehydrogenase
VKVLVTGGTGFVGTNVVHRLRAEGRDVRALVRRPERATRLTSWGVELAPGDVTDAASVAAAADGCTHVVHLVAIIRGRPTDFERVMVDGFRHVLDVARAVGVERVVLMSALGTSEATKELVPYFGAKWRMEQELAASELDGVVLRPSFVFGRGGGALPTFVRQVRLSPVVTVIGNGRQRSQPLWLEDLAAYVARALDLPAAGRRTFELGGPDTVDWDELYRRIAAVLGKHRRLVHVPAALARGGARLTQWLPGAPLSADQVTMIEGPDVVVSDDEALTTFGLPLVPLDEQLRRAIA